MGQALKVIKFDNDDGRDYKSSQKIYSKKLPPYLIPVRIAAIVTAILGVISLVLEVQIYFQFRYEIYLARLIPTILSLLTITIIQTKIARNYYKILTHIYLFTILSSVSFVSFKIPSLFVYNVLSASFFVLTLSLFLYWGKKNQIIAGVYFLILFGVSAVLSNIASFGNETIFFSVFTSTSILIVSVLASYLRESENSSFAKLNLPTISNADSYDLDEESIDGSIVNSVVPLFKCRIDGTFIYINNTLKEILDLDSSVNASDFNFFENVIKNQKITNHLLKKLENKGKVENYRFKFSDKNDGEEVFLLDGNLVTIDDGTYLVGSIRNITSQYKQDKSVKKELESLKQNKRQNTNIIPNFQSSETKRSNVISKMGHELRTPMNSVLGFLTLIENGLFENEEELQEFSHSAKLSAESLLGLINDVVEIAKIQEGIVDVEKSEFNIREEVEKICSNLLPHLEQNELTLSTKIMDDIPEKIIADKSKYLQIIINLLRNAIQSTESGTITVKVESKSTTKGSRLLQTSVEDSSEGIDQSEIERVINEETSGKERDSKITSNILHIMICKELIHLLDGEISVESEIGKGIKFSFSIELEKVEEVAEEKKSSDVKFETSHKSKAKLLLVEDNPISRKVEQKLLKEAGYDVDSVENGASAIEFVEKGIYQLVLMDIELKDMNGLDATKVIRELPEPICNIPIIAVTAHSSMKDREKCLVAGMNDYISKPINITFLKMTIDQWLNEAKAN